MKRHKLILGTVQFGLPYGINNIAGQPSKQKVFFILDKAFEYGITTIDTAAAYGCSEKLIGEFLKKNPAKNFKIITKINNKGSNNFEKYLRISLSHLNVESVDTVLFHSFNDLKENMQDHENKNTIIGLKGKLFQKVGVSLYTNSEIVQILDNDLVEVVQAPFNLLDNESQRGELFKALKDKGKIVHTRSSFLQGLFFMDADEIPSSLHALKPLLDEISDLATTYDISINALALNYGLSKNYIDGVLFGVDDLGQLQNNVSSINQKLSPELIKAIDELFVENNLLLNPSTWQN